jgi:DNA-binding LacI/PurR family transcriptional regulator
VGEPRPTLSTVARAAGVSTMTASNAYNRPDQLSSATRERVLRVAAELGYAGPSPAARSLRRGRSGTIGLMLSEQLPYVFEDPGMLLFLLGMATELAAAGRSLLLIPTAGDPEHALVRGALVDALVLRAISADDPAIAAARERGVPLVSGGGPRLPGVPFVGVDNARGAAKAADHLLGLGHTRFGVVTVHAGDLVAGIAPRPGLHDRARGFVDALARAGVDPGDVQLVEAADHNRSAGRDAATALLTGRSSRRRPTAVFAVSDVLALGVLDAAAGLDVVVPRQLSVVGFDDIAEAARSEPPLTTVSHPLYEQGAAAVRVALAAVDGRVLRPPRLTTHLVVRETTAHPPAGRGSS